MSVDILTFYTRRISDTSRYIHFAAVMMVMTDCRLRCHHQISPITKCHNIKCRSAFMQHVPKHRVFIGKYFPIFPEYFPNISGYFPMKIPKTNYSSPSIDLRWSIRWSIWAFRRVVPSRPSKQCHPRAGVPCLPASVEINKIASNEFFVAWNEIYISSNFI